MSSAGEDCRSERSERYDARVDAGMWACVGREHSLERMPVVRLRTGRRKDVHMYGTKTWPMRVAGGRLMNAMPDGRGTGGRIRACFGEHRND